MRKNDFLAMISQKDFDREYFISLANNDRVVRDLIVSELTGNPWIMVYYHCFYVVAEASRRAPHLYYEYWDRFARLLNHANSYHRDIGLTLLAILAVVDEADRLSTVWTDYLEHIGDAKFMTGQCCIQNLRIILAVRDDLIDETVDRLLAMESSSPYSAKQQALLTCDILDVLDEVYGRSTKKKEITQFIQRAMESISPKTRKRAKQLVAKYWPEKNDSAAIGRS